MLSILLATGLLFFQTTLASPASRTPEHPARPTRPALLIGKDELGNKRVAVIHELDLLSSGTLKGKHIYGEIYIPGHRGYEPLVPTVHSGNALSGTEPASPVMLDQSEPELASAIPAAPVDNFSPSFPHRKDGSGGRPDGYVPLLQEDSIPGYDTVDNDFTPPIDIDSRVKSPYTDTAFETNPRASSAGDNAAIEFINPVENESTPDEILALEERITNKGGSQTPYVDTKIRTKNRFPEEQKELDVTIPASDDPQKPQQVNTNYLSNTNYLDPVTGEGFSSSSVVSSSSGSGSNDVAPNEEVVHLEEPAPLEKATPLEEATTTITSTSTTTSTIRRPTTYTTVYATIA